MQHRQFRFVVQKFQKQHYYLKDNGVATVTLAGTVQGLGRTITKDVARGGAGFERAASGFLNTIKPALPTQANEVYNRYKVNIGSGLNTDSPTAYSISENRCNGTVAFSITYTDNLTANLPSGIASRSCSASINEGVRLFASHAIPFRRLGNLLQDIRTTTEGSITLSCNAQAKNTGDPVVDTNRAIEAVQDELNRLRGIHARPADFVTLRVTGNPTQEIDDRGLSCSASITYAFTVDLAAVQDANTDISLRTL